MPEHTCAGFEDTDCEACEVLRAELAEELPGESRYAGWLYDEPDERDVIGGL